MDRTEGWPGQRASRIAQGNRLVKCECLRLAGVLLPAVRLSTDSKNSSAECSLVEVLVALVLPTQISGPGGSRNSGSKNMTRY